MIYRTTPCGKAGRHCANKTERMTSFRLDYHAVTALNHLQTKLACSPEDRPSISMMVRRALDVYLDLLVHQERDVAFLEVEKLTIRKRTRMPRVRPQEQPSTAD